MAKATITCYTWPHCPYCKKAKGLLDELGLVYTDYDIYGKPEEKQRLIDETGQTTVPYIFFNDKLIGGCDDLFALYKSGDLENALSQ